MKLKVLFLTLMVSASCTTGQKVTSIDPKIESELEQYNTMLSEKKQQGYQYLSPKYFSQANESYKEAKKMAYRGKDFNEVTATLNKGKMQLNKVEESVRLANVHLKDVLEAKKQAQDEGASSNEYFKEANHELTELGEELEEKDINEVLEEKNEVISLFNKAEIMAIQNRELAQTNDLLMKINELDSSDYFDEKIEALEKDISSAKKLITEYKDTPDRYMEAVMNAETRAKELFALTQTAAWIDKQGTKSLAMNLSEDMNSVMTPFSHPAPQELSYAQKMNLLKEEVSMVPLLRNELTSAQMESFLQKRKMKRISYKNEKLNNKLQKKREMQQKIDKIREMFKSNEAKIYIENDDLVISLVGLNFDFNKSQLPNDAKPLLEKTIKAVDTLASDNVIIEGHADAIGDALYNERLSKERAESVNKFLVANSSLTNKNTRVRGLGFKKPLTENKTTQGRKSNRRIDIVIDSAIN